METGKGNRRTRWNSCSRLISISLPFKSLTFCTRSVILPWSSVSISEVVPMARSRVSLTPPSDWPPSHPEWPVEWEGVKQMRWSPLSAEVKVILPLDWPRLETMRWSLSKTSFGFVRTGSSHPSLSGIWESREKEGGGLGSLGEGARGRG